MSTTALASQPGAEEAFCNYLQALIHTRPSRPWRLVREGFDSAIDYIDAMYPLVHLDEEDLRQKAISHMMSTSGGVSQERVDRMKSSVFSAEGILAPITYNTGTLLLHTAVSQGFLSIDAAPRFLRDHLSPETTFWKGAEALTRFMLINPVSPPVIQVPPAKWPMTYEEGGDIFGPLRPIFSPFPLPNPAGMYAAGRKPGRLIDILDIFFHIMAEVFGMDPHLQGWRMPMTAAYLCLAWNAVLDHIDNDVDGRLFSLVQKHDMGRMGERVSLFFKFAMGQTREGDPDVVPVPQMGGTFMTPQDFPYYLVFTGVGNTLSHEFHGPLMAKAAISGKAERLRPMIERVMTVSAPTLPEGFFDPLTVEDYMAAIVLDVTPQRTQEADQVVQQHEVLRDPYDWYSLIGLLPLGAMLKRVREHYTQHSEDLMERMEGLMPQFRQLFL